MASDWRHLFEGFWRLIGDAFLRGFDVLKEKRRKRVGKLSHENYCYRASFTRQTRGPCTSLCSLLLRQQVPYPPMPVYEKVRESRFLEDKPEVADLQVVDKVVVVEKLLLENSSGC